MKKTIIVQKNKAYKIGIRFLFAFFLCFSIILCVAWSPFLWTFLLFSLAISPVFFILLCYEFWKISFASDKIIIKRFFRKTRKYSYYQIDDVCLTYSYTEHEQICISFTDGKRIRFRTEDENAEKALRKIQSHKTVRICHNLYRH